jgi:tRNA modification GTPase
MDTTRQIPDVANTIVALSSAAGAAARAIVRVSGPAAREIAARVFQPNSTRFPARGAHAGALQLPGLHALLPAQVHIFTGPRSYTGQDVVEFHLVGAPPLVDCLIQRLLALGARPALPGEFTMRAFLAAKIDLTQAEAVLGVLQAGSRQELQSALAQLAGGVLGPMQQLREDLLCLLADLEAGLDFADEDIQFVESGELEHRLNTSIEQISGLLVRLQGRSVHRRPFRVVLVGPPNAGKSSLFNALLGKEAALTSSTAGTTRDYLSEFHRHKGCDFELVDTAGIQEAVNAIEEQAQLLRSRQGADSDLLLICSTQGHCDNEPAQSSDRCIHVRTKCDLTELHSDALATSARTGAGLEALWEHLLGAARRFNQGETSAHAARSIHHLDKTLQHLQEARIFVKSGQAELIAAELHGALAELGEMTGAVFTDDLLDRIFSRFCIGK